MRTNPTVGSTETQTRTGRTARTEKQDAVPIAPGETFETTSSDVAAMHTQSAEIKRLNRLFKSLFSRS